MVEVRTYLQASPTADAHPEQVPGVLRFACYRIPIVVAMLRYLLPERTLVSSEIRLVAGVLPFNQKTIHLWSDLM